MTRIYLNGKFTAQPMTGVQRVAWQLVLALDHRPDDYDTLWTLLCPPSAPVLSLRRIEIRRIGLRGLPLHLWEQLVLPWVTRGDTLVNLAGAAPWFARRQACLLHDAAVFDVPGAYTREFVAWYGLLFRHLARTSAKLMTVSAFSRKRLSAGLGVAVERIAVVPNGGDHLDRVVPDESVLARHGLSGTRFLLVVGSANANKNTARVIAAHALLRDAPAHCLVMVGTRNDQVFADVPATESLGVLHVGAVSDSELKALYRHADALIFPSLYEGFGLPPIEAMACGCPVAVSSAAALPEVCGEAAVYFDPLSVEEIAATMESLLSNEALRSRLRLAGLAHVRSMRWADSVAVLARELQTLSVSKSSR